MKAQTPIHNGMPNQTISVAATTSGHQPVEQTDTRTHWLTIQIAIIVLSVFITTYGIVKRPDMALLYLANLVTQFNLLWFAISLRERQALSIGNMIFCLWFVMNLCRGVIFTLGNFTGDMRQYLYALREADMTSAALLVTLFTFVLAAGSHMRLPGLGPAMAKIFSVARFSRAQVVPLAILAGIVCVSAIVFSTTGEALSSKRIYETSSGVSTRFGPITFLLIAIMFYVLTLSYFLYKQKRSRGMLLICGLTILAIAFTISLRTYLLFFVLPFIMDAARKSSLKAMFATIMLVPFLAVFLGYVTYERNFGNAFEELAIEDTFAEAAEAITLNANYGGYLSTAMSTTAIEHKAPVLYGRTLFIDPIMQFVPRTVWPDKPEELGGQLRPLQQDVGILPRNIVGGVPPGIVAEFWLNGRIPGILLLGFLTGAFLSGFAEYRNQITNANTQAVLSTVAICIVFFWFGGHAARIVISLAQLFALAVVIGIVHRLFARQANQ